MEHVTEAHTLKDLSHGFCKRTGRYTTTVEYVLYAHDVL